MNGIFFRTRHHHIRCQRIGYAHINFAFKVCSPLLQKTSQDIAQFANISIEHLEIEFSQTTFQDIVLTFNHNISSIG